MLHVFVFTVITPAHTVISAVSLFTHPLNLPATSKGHCPISLGARGCYEIIFGVPIKVAAEPTSLTSIRLGQAD